MSLRSSLVFTLVVVTAGAASAQQPPGSTQGGSQPPPAGQVAPAPVTAGWQDGFVIQAANGDFRLALGGLGQVDGRFSVDEPSPIIDTFTVRKARPILTARVGRYFDFRVMPDFAGGQAVLLDAYMDVRFSPAFRIRIGKDKTPVGYEMLISDAALPFPERSLASSLVPNRDVGLQAQGDLFAAKLSYSLGVFNGVPDATNSTTDVDTNNGKDVAARVIVQPFRVARDPGPLNGFGFHIGGSTGSQSAAVPSFRTSAGQTYYSYAAGTTAGGDRTRFTPAVFYYFKQVGGFAEFVRSSQEVVRLGTTTEVANEGWNATAVWVLTGEAASAGAVRPRNNFDPAAGHWGALQLLGRYSHLSVDAGVIEAGLAAAGASREADQVTVGANWYANPWFKTYLTFERTTFDSDAEGARPTENVILFRFQVAF